MKTCHVATPFRTGKLNSLRKTALQPLKHLSTARTINLRQCTVVNSLPHQPAQLVCHGPAQGNAQQGMMEKLRDCVQGIRGPSASLLTAMSVAALGLAVAQPALADAVLPGVSADSQLQEGFVSGFLLIFFSELGDKTFFIAMLLASRQSQTAVFAGTFGALVVMTLISVGLGQVLHEIDELLPPNAANLPLDDVLAAALLVWFGVRTLQDAADADASAAEEKEEAQEVVSGMALDPNSLGLILSTFALVFAAEWGDKSFLATIALSAASSPVGVVGGAIAGHGVATAMAVLGGSFLAKYFSERVLQYAGGSLFLVFAAVTVFDIVKHVQQ